MSGLMKSLIFVVGLIIFTASLIMAFEPPTNKETLSAIGILIGADESFARDLARFNYLHDRVSLKACNPTGFSALTGAIPEGFQLFYTKRANPYMSLNHGLHFSGGEPFLNFKLLLKAVEIAETLKIPSTFVETNCFWCKTDALIRERLQILKDNGLKGILISVNPFYTEYVPFERTDRYEDFYPMLSDQT